MDNFYNIDIGKIINSRVQELGFDDNKVCKFVNCTLSELHDCYNNRSIDTDILLKLSKLLNYDFFRLYSQHLILHSPMMNEAKISSTKLPLFRKNIYTKEIIDFILYKIKSNDMTVREVIIKYNIPKTTLYKWIKKYNNL